MPEKPLTTVTFFPLESPYANIVLKREDLSPTGSHKCRYARQLLQRMREQGVQRVVLSTTGNAGITLSHYGREMGITVICLMSDRGDLNKASQIESEGGVVIVTPRPVRFAKYIAKRYDLPLLRISRDPESLKEYRSLGAEIRSQVPDAQAIVNFCSSGASTLGLVQAYADQLPALHLAQTGQSVFLVEALHPDHLPEALSGVGLKDSPYRDQLLELIQQSDGDAWYIDADQQAEAARILKEEGIETSMESLCSFAAALQIRERYDQIVVILSGRQWPNQDFRPSIRASSFTEIDDLMRDL